MQDSEDQRINDKHFRIRGSHDLKYPANKQRCEQTCGHFHDHTTNSHGLTFIKEHRCFLKAGHKEQFCEFSSACGESGVKGLIPESLADDGFVILKTVA